MVMPCSTLGFEPIHQQGGIDVPRHSAVGSRIAGERRNMVLENERCIEK